MIEFLASVPEALTLSAIASALERSPSEIFRVIRTLEQRGYLARQLGDRYALTNRFFEQGLRRPTTASLLEIAYPEMRALAALIGQSCHISVPSGDVMVTVARVEELRSASFVVPIGFSVPLTESASGRVYLAYLPQNESAGHLADLTPKVRNRLLETLSQIRARGYELAPSAGVTGLTDLSFPLFEADSRPSACLAVPIATRRKELIPLKDLVNEVGRAAERIDACLARLRRV